MNIAEYNRSRLGNAMSKPQLKWLPLVQVMPALTISDVISISPEDGLPSFHSFFVTSASDSGRQVHRAPLPQDSAT